MWLLQGLQDPHAKVRWAACQAVGQMCTDLGPDIQNDEHAVIVPALTEVMKDFNEPRVQAHAAAAIVNFSENCDEEILTGYLDNLITQLLGLLQNGQKLVKVCWTAGARLTMSLPTKLQHCKRCSHAHERVQLRQHSGRVFLCSCLMC